MMVRRSSAHEQSIGQQKRFQMLCVLQRKLNTQKHTDLMLA
jgi:hypothetical protein